MTASLNIPSAFANASDQATPITVAPGDGIGPEIMQATLNILAAAGAQLSVEPITIGEAIYNKGISTGIEPTAWDSLRRTRVFLKAPITTPQGGGFKSLNVTIRKTMGLFANVRPCIAYPPFVPTHHPKLDIVIVRENEEDTYAGIEHQQTDEVTQCLKIISRPGCERIIRYAFEYAKRNNRRKVTAFVKDNIMKITDGLFHRVFDEIAMEYPDIAADHKIVDIGTALIADQPERFDVVVMPNLYGDIVSDVVAQIAGSVGLAGSANIGQHCAMFEAIHGSAPDIAGQGIANPSALINGAVIMLVHLNQTEAAQRIHNALLATIEAGIHTSDIYSESLSTQRVDTQAFAAAVIDHLGQQPQQLPAVTYRAAKAPWVITSPKPTAPAKKRLVGVDIFLHWAAADRDPNALGQALTQVQHPQFKLQSIANRGVKVYPGGHSETFCTDHWVCRYQVSNSDDNLNHQHIVTLLQRLAEQGFDFIKTEHLYTFNGQRAYALSQGE